MVKQLVSAIAAFALLGGLGANAEDLKASEVIGYCDQLSDEQAKKGDKVNFRKKLNVLRSCVQKELTIALKKTNDLAKVYTYALQVNGKEYSTEFYDALDIAYNEAMLNIRAAAVAEQGLSKFSEEMEESIKNDAERAEQKAAQKAEDKLNEKIRERDAAEPADGILDAIGGMVDRLASAFGGKDLKDLDKKEKELIRARAEEIISGKRFVNSTTEKGKKVIQGLVTYATMVLKDEAGRAQLLVIAYRSDKTDMLHDALVGNHTIPFKGNRAQCRRAEEIADKLSDERLITQLGTSFFWDENCQPALLSFSIGSVDQSDPDEASMNQEMAEDMVKMSARDHLAKFLGTHTSVDQNTRQISESLKVAIVEAVEGELNGAKDARIEAKKKLARELHKTLKSTASANTMGMREVKTWYVDKGDLGVVGTIVAYSVGEKRAAAQSGKKQPSKAAPKASSRPGVSVNSNAFVDDF